MQNYDFFITYKLHHLYHNFRIAAVCSECCRAFVTQVLPHDPFHSADDSQFRPSCCRLAIEWAQNYLSQTHAPLLPDQPVCRSIERWGEEVDIGEGDNKFVLAVHLTKTWMRRACTYILACPRLFSFIVVFICIKRLIKSGRLSASQKKKK